MKTYNIFALLAMLLIGSLSINAQDYQETEGFVSSDIIPDVKGLPIVRKINSGTVFKVQYVGKWSPEMKGAFEMACKIVGEALPPMPPITVRAEIGSGSSANSLSRIFLNQLGDFSNGNLNEISLVPQVKYTVLKEFETNSYYQFFNSIKTVDFFEDFSKPDIRIVYYQNRLDECSFNLDNPQADKYDFVSVVIRDIFKGIGFMCGIRLNQSTNTLIGLNNLEKTALDKQVASALALPGKTPVENATGGAVKLPLGYNGTESVSLYAPNPWANNVSLNYFTPDGKYKLTSTLTYLFGKGTVTRDVADDKMTLYRELLHWDPYLKSGGQSSSVGNGSTSDLMPYQGSIAISTSAMAAASTEGSVDDTATISSSAPLYAAGDVHLDEIGFIIDYLTPFHINYNAQTETISGEDGWTVSILKKDGTWDCVAHTATSSPDLYVNASDLTLHYDDGEYARSCDGYLRCRATRSYRVTGGSNPRRYDARYFVMDYLPQAVEIGISSETGTPSGASPLAATTPVKIGMKNLEGVTRVVLEVKPQGARVPNKIEVTNPATGTVVLDLPTGKSATIIPVSYNANGSTRGETLTITAQN